MRKLLHDWKRVLRVARKPDIDEYLRVAKITGLGILLVGFIGFIIMFINYIIQGIFPAV